MLAKATQYTVSIGRQKTRKRKQNPRMTNPLPKKRNGDHFGNGRDDQSVLDGNEEQKGQDEQTKRSTASGNS